MRSVTSSFILFGPQHSAGVSARSEIVTPSEPRGGIPQTVVLDCQFTEKAGHENGMLRNMGGSQRPTVHHLDCHVRSGDYNCLGVTADYFCWRTRPQCSQKLNRSSWDI